MMVPTPFTELRPQHYGGHKGKAEAITMRKDYTIKPIDNGFILRFDEGLNKPYETYCTSEAEALDALIAHLTRIAEKELRHVTN